MAWGSFLHDRVVRPLGLEEHKKWLRTELFAPDPDNEVVRGAINYCGVGSYCYSTATPAPPQI